MKNKEWIRANTRFNLLNILYTYKLITCELYQILDIYIAILEQYTVITGTSFVDQEIVF